MALSTIGSIATHIVESFSNLPTGISGNMVEIVDMNRIHVQNYTGQTIGSNAISETFQPTIVDLSKADAIDSSSGQGDFSELKLADLSIGENSGEISKSLRDSAMDKLKMLGQKRRFARSVS